MKKKINFFKKRFLIMIVIFLFNSCSCNRKCDDCRNDPLSGDILLYQSLQESLLKTIKIKVKNKSDLGDLNLVFCDQEISLKSSEISNSVTIFFDSATIWTGKYKFSSSTRGVIIDQESYDFKGTFNDGVFIRENSTLIPASEGCNIFDGAQGKILHQTSCD